MLGRYNKATYKPLFEKAVYDSSYTVAGNALDALNNIDAEEANAIAEKLSTQPSRGNLAAAITEVFIKSGDETKFDLVEQRYDDMPTSQKKLDELPYFAGMLLRVKNTDQLKKGVDAIVKLRDSITGEQKEEIAKAINDNILKAIANRKDAAGLKDQADYIKSKIDTTKKGF